MKGIMIDARNQQVREVDLPDASPAHLKALQDSVEGNIEVAFALKNNDTLYVNEEGLFLPPPIPMFEFLGAPQRLYAGNGILVGFDPETGDDADVQTPIDAVRAVVIFHTAYAVIHEEEE
jgi:hypothetical protein